MIVSGVCDIVTPKYIIFCSFRATFAVESKTQGVALGYALAGLSARLPNRTGRKIFEIAAAIIHGMGVKDESFKNRVREFCGKIPEYEDYVNLVSRLLPTK